MLNNNRPGPLTTAISVFTASGVETVLPAMQMVANESKLVELRRILQNAGLEHQELGWIKLVYSGINLEMGAQLTVYPSANDSGVDSPRSLGGDYKSTKRSAVFWMPAGGRASLALTNVAITNATVTATCDLETETYAIPQAQPKPRPSKPVIQPHS